VTAPLALENRRRSGGGLPKAWRGSFDARRPGLVRGGLPGFTLLEIAVVIFIMALIMTIAIPYFGGLHAAELRSQARRLAGRANYLYDESAAQKLVLRLTFDLDTNSYFVSRLDPYAAKPAFAPEHGPAGGRFVLPQGVRLRDVSVEGIGTLRHGVVSSFFYPQGYVDATVVHLADDAGQVLTISIDPLTGHVAIQSGDLSPRQALALVQ
jgi:prepilin-type N-terminal cleavage/methylation domain-containing protein